MKLNNKNILGSMALLGLFLTTACSDNMTLDSNTNGTDGEMTVTFTISPYSKAMTSRADIDDDTDPDMTVPVADFHISDGSHADVLLYAVYRETADGFVLAPEFQKYNSTVGNLTPANGQNAVAMDKDSWPYEMKLALDPSKNYKVVFWAQNSTSNAFDTSDLTKIKANYTDALNNDELRDAFSAVVDINGSSTSTREVIMHRPMAQINVGTAGWDYEGAAVLRPSNVSYSQSRITLEGVAQYYNALTQSTITRDENGEDLLTDVTFKYNRLPAFIHLNDFQWENLTYMPNSNEEFLIVKRYADNDIADRDVLVGGFHSYKSWQDYLDFRDSYDEEFSDGERPRTEMFKYLSMCYVFVPEPAGNSGAVISKVTFEAEGKTEGSGIGEVFSITNVPVQKNWRTNILSDCFFVLNYQYHVYIVPDYQGDYNNVSDMWQNGDVVPGDNKWVWDGPANPNQEFEDLYGDDYYGRNK